VIWGSPVGTEDAYREILLRSSKVVTFRTFANCVTAVRAWYDHHEFLARRRSPFAHPVRRRARGAAGALETLALAPPSGALSEHDSKRLLAAYDIAVTREHLAGTAAEAARAAASIGYPVVVKACGAELAHKSDRGLVRIGLTSARQVHEAFAELAPASAADTVLVSELVDGGVEAVVGLAHDELFGPTVMAGLGGVLVEVLHDVAFRVPPFSRDEARRMVGALRGFPLLRGVRGRPPADVTALVDVIMKVQRMGVDLAGELAELDVNPLLVRPRGQGAIALDALAVRSADPVRG
jgi:acyl-CoA synthetase (NDP forming)